MQFLLDTLRSVPDVIWSGVIASILTLGGVLISNSSNTKRLRVQLQHDSIEKARERLTVLRRDVYLKIVEELTRASSYLAELPHKDPSKERLAEGVQGFTVAAAKVQLVSEPKTALLANELSAAYGVLSVRLMARAMPLQSIQKNIQLQDDLWRQAQDQVKRVLAEMVRFNEARETDRQRWEALQRSFDGFSSEAASRAKARAQSWDAFNLANVEFSKQFFSDLQAIARMQIPVLAEMRRELGLATELETMQAQTEELWDKMVTELYGAFEEVRAKQP